MSILSREILEAGLREAARIAEGFVPGEAELAGAPVLSHWAVQAQPGGTVRLIGVVSGHPSIRDGWCTTSVVLAADINAGWARTVSRYYRLGPMLGEGRH